jgi:glucose-1-phosphate thymidylyltransferase
LKALILAAGYATRMYPLTQTQPKSLLPIGKRVVIDWTMHDVSAVTAICTVDCAAYSNDTRDISE